MVYNWAARLFDHEHLSGFRFSLPNHSQVHRLSDNFCPRFA